MGDSLKIKLLYYMNVLTGKKHPWNNTRISNKQIKAQILSYSNLF